MTIPRTPDAEPSEGRPQVRPGQVWADNDKRSPGRQVKIIRLTQTHAVVRPAGEPRRNRRLTQIRLDRFKPTSTGYTLVQDVDGGESR